MSTLRNYTFDEITLGQTVRYTKTVEELDVELFAAVSGDVNPVHLDANYAATTPFGERIAHGMLTGAIVSAALAMELPGPGTVYLSQSLRFRKPVKLGDEVTVTLTVKEKQARRKTVTLECKVHNQLDKLVASGVAEVIPPSETLQIERPATPAFKPARS